MMPRILVQRRANVLNGEIWVAVIGSRHYEVSNQGRARRVTADCGTSPGRILSPVVDQNGYGRVTITFDDGSRQTRLLHRIIAEAFLGPTPEGKDDVAHYDGDSSNASLENLRWASRSENERDKWRHGTHKKGERHHWATLTDQQVKDIIALYGDGSVTTHQTIADQYGVKREAVSRIFNGRTWTHITDGIDIPKKVWTEKPLSGRDIETLRALEAATGHGWAAPKDCGGFGFSHHSYTLAKLAKRGYADRRKNGHAEERGSCHYRINVKGREFLLSFSPTESV